jgi:hypothetical protein
MPDLSDGANWSEVDSNNNNASPNGWPEGMMPSGVNDSARADKGALKRFWDKLNPVQGITQVGGVYTFVTANTAYPTSYVGGEIYCFNSNTYSAGGEQFQVNSLGPKPIWKRFKGSGSIGGNWVPIIAQDIQGNTPAQLVYHSDLNSGTGVFLLLNPFVPIDGDGAGNVTVPGSISVAGGVDIVANGMWISGDIKFGIPGHPDKSISYITSFQQAPGNRRIGICAADPGAVYSQLEEFWVNAGTTTMTGTVDATGYGSRSGISGPSQINNFNIEWNGTQAHLWIDSTDIGPIVTGSAGNVVIGGNASVGSLTASGDITAGGNFHQNGYYHYFAGSSGTVNSTGGPFIYADGNAIVLHTGNGTIGFEVQNYTGNNVFLVNNNGNTTVYGTLSVSGNATFSNAYAGVLTGGTLQVNANGNVSGNFTCSGNAQIANQLTTTDCIVNGNLTVGGLLNGHPAMAMTELMTQLDALTARVRVLEGR